MYYIKGSFQTDAVTFLRLSSKLNGAFSQHDEIVTQCKFSPQKVLYYYSLKFKSNLKVFPSLSSKALIFLGLSIQIMKKIVLFHSGFFIIHETYINMGTLTNGLTLVHFDSKAL